MSGRDLSIALVGAGRMGMALALSWSRDAHVCRLDMFDPLPSETAQALADGQSVRLNPLPEPADVLVLAVKPQVFGSVAPTLPGLIGPETLIVSIMAGVTLARLRALTGHARLVRAMPNTPGQIGAGITGYGVAPGLSPSDDALARRLLGALGPVVGPLPEAVMPEVTAVSGSGPAYVFALVETLAAAGEAEGLPPDAARALARQTLIGAAALLDAERGTPPEALRAAVTSPGGTTQAALAVLMAPEGLPHLMRATVRAAAARDRELGQSEVSHDRTDKPNP